MSIRRHTLPELAAIHEARALEAVCKAQDGLTGTLFLDPSLNHSPEIPCLFTLDSEGELAALLTLFAPSQSEAELFGLTHPAHRRKGCFRALVRAAAESANAFGIQDLLFLCERTSESGNRAVSALGATLDFTEYSLRFGRARSQEQRPVPNGLALREATPADLDDMAAISGACFSEPPEQARHFLIRSMEADNRAQYIAHLSGVPAGICATGMQEGEATIFGLAVLPALQNKGIGRGIIALILQDLFARGIAEILIEVDSTNARALHLYKSVGFVVETVNDYYRVPVESILSRV